MSAAKRSRKQRWKDTKKPGALRLEKVSPDMVHITLPTRPPAETWVHPPDEESLMQAIITRHPLRQSELERTLERYFPGQTNQVLMDLMSCGRAQVVERHGVQFWSAAPSHYPDVANSLRAQPKMDRQGKKQHE